MAVNDFAQGLMVLDKAGVDSESLAVSLTLTSEERDLFANAAAEDPAAEGFVFATSASLRAIDYVRKNQRMLAPATKTAFGAFVTERFSSAISLPSVESGCIKACNIARIP
jgi:hypothetical protein